MESHGYLKLMYAHLEENMSCPICEGTMKASRILACDHTYCSECVKNLVAIKGLTPNIKCCLCQKETRIPSTGLNSREQNCKLKCLLKERAAITKKIEALFAEQEQGTTEATETLRIWVRVDHGKTPPTHTVNVSKSDTIDTLKRQIEKKIGILSDLQFLIYRGRELYPGSKTLEEIGISKESMMLLRIRLLGGDDTQ